MRRWLFLLWIGILLVPALGLLGPHERSSAREARLLAQPPAPPLSLAALLDLPRQADAFVRDQFGFRPQIVRASAALRESLNDEAAGSGNFLRGRDGFLLLREGLSESLGFTTSPEAAAQSGALACEVQRRSVQSGARFLYTIAPSPTTIYPEVAPDGMGPPIAPTDYDLVLQAARACGAEVLDLRAPLRARREAALLYRRTDTHWTPRGAVIAFNSIVSRLDHPELRVDSRLFRWRTREVLGDMTRIAGALEADAEMVETPELRRRDHIEPTETPLPQPDPTVAGFVRDYPRDGLSVLLIGDSFTHAFFPNYLAPVARRVTFIHHQRCGFDWREVERAQADIVLFMPTERFALCEDGARPAHFDEAPAATAGEN